ncbi:Predicted ATPase [Roseivivax halotolerans]|uniref:Predicted ATPase n=1 Tax=Roseivivax halotolerans TaxID=93684 RepID=A0A1I5XGE4_9RHOB|nr:AAA family ATPase [Roseivivax halotolerans]SFQ30994.1 Predicted ATPase [Roseivivax halotolerans]
MDKRKTISKIFISGFKSIDQTQEIELTGLNVVLGANGAGKSSFVAFFKLLSEMMKGNLQVWSGQQGGADRLLSYGIKHSQEIRSKIRFGLNGYDFKLVPVDNGGLIFLSEDIYFNGRYGEKWINLGNGHAEAKLPKSHYEREFTGTEGDMISYAYESISHWQIYHFHDTSDTALVKRYGAEDDNLFLRHDAANLAAFLYRLKKKNKRCYKSIVDTISLAIPFFDDFHLEPRELPSQEQQINLRWRQKGSDYILWPSQLSDGSIRFICLATALLQPDPPSTIIIDEPELGLHPYAITLLASLFQSASNRMQVITSTQSTELVNHFSPENILIVERDGGSSTFGKLDADLLQDWLEEYSLGELWNKNILGGRPGHE